VVTVTVAARTYRSASGVRAGRAAGPGVWGPGVWGPGVWSTGVWGPGVWAPGVAVVQSEPRVFVERDAPAAQPQQWWYWCQSAQGYYPYVSTCSEGWRRVEPQVPQGQQ
jgi:hypothetical protein